MKMWIGKEKEGVYKGLVTLFIPSPLISYISICNILEKYKKIQQIYFGAGRCSNINQDVVKECIMKNQDKLITLEIDLNKLYNMDKKILSFCNIIITINNDNFRKIDYKHINNYQIKLQSLKYKPKVLMIANLDNFDFVDVSKLQFKKYKGDKIIEDNSRRLVINKNR
jgi:hypothetical protein